MKSELQSAEERHQQATAVSALLRLRLFPMTSNRASCSLAIPPRTFPGFASTGKRSGDAGMKRRVAQQ